MSASPVKISVLALTAEAAKSLPGWRYMPTGVRLVATPCPGVTVTLRRFHQVFRSRRSWATGSPMRSLSFRIKGTPMVPDRVKRWW